METEIKIMNNKYLQDKYFNQKKLANNLCNDRKCHKKSPKSEKVRENFFPWCIYQIHGQYVMF